MGTFDPVRPARTKPRAVRKSKTLTQKMAAYIGCDTSDTWPPDTARRHKEYLPIRADDERLTQAAASTSEPSFAAVWDNDEDAAYDRS